MHHLFDYKRRKELNNSKKIMQAMREDVANCASPIEPIDFRLAEVSIDRYTYCTSSQSVESVASQ